MDDQVRSVPLPPWLMRYVLNPAMRRLLPSRLGARIPLALLRVTGRRSGRRYEIPVGVHQAGGQMVVLSPAGWVQNFKGGADAELVHAGGRVERVRGELVEDAAGVGPLLRAVLDAGTSPSTIRLSVPAGHRVTDEEAAAVRKAVVLRVRTD